MLTYVLIAIAGVGIGVLSGLFGIGGGTVMVPLFRLVFGVEPLVATSTSLFSIIPTSLTGAIKHIKNHTSIVKVGVASGVGGAITSILGGRAALVSPSWLIMLACAIVIIYSATTMIRSTFVSKHAEHQEVRDIDADETSIQFSVDGKMLLIASIIGALAGFMSGYVGVGGGFLMVPLFARLFQFPMKVCSGTSLVAVCILATPAVIQQALLGNVAFLMGSVLVIGSIPGAWMGAYLTQYIPDKILKRIFSLLLICVGIVLFVNEFVGA